MKLLIKLALVVVVLLVVGVVVLIYSIDRIARAGIERGATFALGVPVTLQSANVGILKGTFSMDDLNVGNPEGFRTEHFLNLGEGAVAVTLPTLRQDVVELPSLRLENISINLEKSGGKANYAIITDSLKRFETSGGDTAGSGESDAKRFIVRELAIRDVAIHVDLIPVGGELTRANLSIDEIVLRDIGAHNARGVVMGELASIVIKAILQVAAEKGGGILPADIVGDLGSRLSQLADVEGLKSQLTEGIGKALEGAPDGVKEAVEGATEDLRKGLDGIGERLRPR